MPNPNTLQDAPQRAYSFLMQQATMIEPAVYKHVYPEIQYPMLVPVDYSAPEWVKSITYRSMDNVGEASWFSGKAQDVPNVEAQMEKFETAVSMAAIGSRYDTEELNDAMMHGINISAEKAVAARRVAEEFTDRVAMVGDASKNYTGLLNSAAPVAVTAPADGTSSATTFASKTADQVLRDINAALTGVFLTTIGAEMADTILLPYSVLIDIGTRRIDTVNQTTILEWIQRNNVYTMTTGQQLTIRGVFNWLDTAGAGSTTRMVVYRNNPEVLKMHIPMPYKVLEVWRIGPMLFELPGIFRLGGVDFRRPKSVRYVDGV